jgi:hypothetical protein
MHRRATRKARTPRLREGDQTLEYQQERDTAEAAANQRTQAGDIANEGADRSFEMENGYAAP